MDQHVTPRSEYVDFWNEILEPKFTRFKHILVDGLTHHSAKVFPSLNVRSGDKVVDVGCGFGDTAIELARRVGPSGFVLGLDCCDAFLSHGRHDAEMNEIGNVEFVAADVETYPFTPDHDFCFSRFGTQFFQNPVVALKNMRRALKPGGTMTMIVWRTIDDNPWLGLPKEVVSRFLPQPGEDARSYGPGPFSMADPDVVTLQLKSAGYEDIGFERIDAPVLVGSTPKDAVAFQLALGPAGEIYREAGEVTERRHDEITEALEAELARHHTAEGIVMNSSSWRVTARNPV